MRGSGASVEEGVKPESQEGEGVGARADEGGGKTGAVGRARRVAAEVTAPRGDYLAAAFVRRWRWWRPRAVKKGGVRRLQRGGKDLP